MVELPRYFQKKLHNQEEVKLFVRPFSLVYSWWFFLSFVLLAGPLYLFFYLIRFGIKGWVVLALVFFLGLLVLIKTIVVWRFTAVVITNQRIIDFDRRDLFHRQVSEASFSNIQDITFEQKGFLAWIFSFGTIRVQTAGQELVLSLQNIRYPQDVQERLVEIKSDFDRENKEKPHNLDWSKSPEYQSLFQSLRQKKREMGEKDFKKAVRQWLDEE